MLVSDDGTFVKIDTHTYKEIRREEFNRVDWGNVVILEITTMGNFGENTAFHNLKHLLLTFENPCFSLH